MAEISATELSATYQAVVSQIVQTALRQKAFLIPTVRDYSGQAVPGMDRLKIPKKDDALTVELKGENSSLTKQEMVFTTDDLLLDKKHAILVSVEEMEEVQANIDARAEIIETMAGQMALKVDLDILTQLKLASAAGPDHRVQWSNNPTDTILEADILEARKLLSQASVPLEDRFMAVSPAQEKSLLSIANFTRLDASGSDSINTGKIGNVYGFTTLVHNGLADDEAVFWHRDSVAYASQQAVSFKEDDDLENVARRMLMTVLYGVKVLDSGKRSVLLNSTGA